MEPNSLVFLSYIFWHCVLTCAGQQITEELVLSVLDCTKKGQLLFKETKSCHDPMTQGPCIADHILVLDTESLLGKCQLSKPCLFFEMWNGTACMDIHEGGCDSNGMRWWMTISGEFVCGCDKGWVRHQETDSCHQLSTQGWCPEGQLLQESENVPDCNCVSMNECPAYQEDKNSIHEDLHWTLNKVEADAIRLGMTRCAKRLDKEEHKVCCEKKRLLTRNFDVSEILVFFKRRHNQDVSCLPHYCANGMIPWPGFPNKCFRVNKKRGHGNK